MERKRINKITGLIYELSPFNRRKNPRFKVKQCLECRCVYKELDEQRELSAWIIDVSGGGLLLMTGKSKIYPQTELSVNFKLPNHQEEILISGVVVRTYRRQAEVNHFSGVSVGSENKVEIKLLLDFVCSEQE